MRTFAVVATLLSALLASPWARAQTRAEIYDGAFRDAQMATGSRTALALSRGAARLAAGDADLAALIRARQDASDAAATAESAEVAARTAVAPDAAAVAKAATAAEAARLALRTADAALSARSPGYAQLTGIAPVAVRDAQALLRPGEAIVMIHATPEHS